MLIAATSVSHADSNRMEARDEIIGLVGGVAHCEPHQVRRWLPTTSASALTRQGTGHGDDAPAACARLYGRMEWTFFTQMEADKTAAPLKSDYVKRFGIPARVFTRSTRFMSAPVRINALNKFRLVPCFIWTSRILSTVCERAFNSMVPSSRTFLYVGVGAGQLETL